MSKAARRYVLEALCERLRREGWPKPIPKRELVGRSTEDPSVETRYVEYQIGSLASGGYVEEDEESTIHLRPSGIDEYESLTGDRVSPGGFLTEVLETLDERDDGDGPGVARTALLRETGAPEEQLDRTVRFLEARGDVTTVSGRGKPFLTARITPEGRARIE